MFCFNSHLDLWYENEDISPSGLVIMYTSTNLPHCVMPFRLQVDAVSLYNHKNGWNPHNQSRFIE